MAENKSLPTPDAAQWPPVHPAPSSRLTVRPRRPDPSGHTPRRAVPADAVLLRTDSLKEPAVFISASQLKAFTLNVNKHV